MNVISAIMHSGFSRAVIQEELARDEFEQATRQRLWNVRHSFFNRDTRTSKKVFDVGCDPDARILNQLKRFFENAFGESLIYQFESGPHATGPSADGARCCISFCASATALMASLA